MSDQLLFVLQICLLALVYLVFLRVVRAVWVELRADGGAPPSRPAGRPRRSRPAPAPAPPAARPARPPVAGADRLVVVAPSTMAGHTFALAGETTIGRASGCGVSIDDAHVSKLHARLYRDGGAWLLEDLGSTNGTLLDGAAVTAPTPVGPGGRIQIGEIVMELA